VPTRRACASLACLAALLSPCARAPAPRSVDAGRLGRVAVFAPEGGHAGLVYLFSDAAGWNDALARTAQRIAAGGAAVVGVDLPQYLRGLAATEQDQCHYAVAELEDWSHRLQRELGYERYRSPILAGVGAGATLAYAALAQSPAATVAGAIGAAPAPALATRVPLCAGAASRAVAGGFAYAPGAALPGFWRDVAAGDEPLASAIEAAVASQNPEDDAELADLPLVEMPADARAGRFAVVYSGDGGWRDIDKQIGEFLAASGTPCVGVDSLRYFWRERTPAETAADLARIVRHYQQAWGLRDVLLVGYSFGAGILPATVNRLPDDVRAAVLQLSLLGLEPRAPFEIEVSGWLGGLPEDAPAVLPELVRLELARVQCFYGEEEEQTLCTDPALRGAERIRTRGGHHFDGDYEALARRILDGAARRAALTSPPPPGSSPRSRRSRRRSGARRGAARARPPPSAAPGTGWSAPSLRRRTAASCRGAS
jgi:type IV secretory pathway VirJ component